MQDHAQDRYCFIVSDNTTMFGTRFFTYLFGLNDGTLTSHGDIISVYNANSTVANVTVWRYNGAAANFPGNYTALVSQTIQPDSVWQTGGTTAAEAVAAGLPGWVGTLPNGGTNPATSENAYAITSDVNVLVDRGDEFDSDNDNTWTCAGAADTGAE